MTTAATATKTVKRKAVKAKKPKERKIRKPSSGERLFMAQWDIFGSVHFPYEREYEFHPKRKWPFDFAWLTKRVAVEIEGGAFIQGRHTRGVGFTEDLVKYNQAVVHGWKVLRYTPQQLRADPQGCVNEILSVLGTHPAHAVIEDKICRCEKGDFGNDIICAKCGGYLF